VDDPLIARILDLTEKIGRLRLIISALRRERKSIMEFDSLGGTEAKDDGEPSRG
jgi:hypothetical protein